MESTQFSNMLVENDHLLIIVHKRFGPICMNSLSYHSPRNCHSFNHGLCIALRQGFVLVRGLAPKWTSLYTTICTLGDRLEQILQGTGNKFQRLQLDIVHSNVHEHELEVVSDLV